MPLTVKMMSDQHKVLQEKLTGGLLIFILALIVWLTAKQLLPCLWRASLESIRICWQAADTGTLSAHRTQVCHPCMLSATQKSADIFPMHTGLHTQLHLFLRALLKPMSSLLWDSGAGKIKNLFSLNTIKILLFLEAATILSLWSEIAAIIIFPTLFTVVDCFGSHPVAVIHTESHLAFFNPI